MRACVHVRVCVRECVCVCFGGEDERKEENKDNEKDEKLYDGENTKPESVHFCCLRHRQRVFFLWGQEQEWQLSYLA